MIKWIKDYWSIIMQINIMVMIILYFLSFATCLYAGVAAKIGQHRATKQHLLVTWSERTMQLSKQLLHAHGLSGGLGSLMRAKLAREENQSHPYEYTKC